MSWIHLFLYRKCLFSNTNYRKLTCINCLFLLKQMRTLQSRLFFFIFFFSCNNMDNQWTIRASKLTSKVPLGLYQHWSRPYQWLGPTLEKLTTPTYIAVVFRVLNTHPWRRVTAFYHSFMSILFPNIVYSIFPKGRHFDHL